MQYICKNRKMIMKVLKKAYIASLCIFILIHLEQALLLDIFLRGLLLYLSVLIH